MAQGPVQLILMPGMDGTGELFAPLQAELARVAPQVDVHVLRYPADLADYADLLAFATRTLQQNDLTGKPFILLGESFSGPLAIRLAATRPAGLAGLVLCCTFATAPRAGLAVLASLAAPGLRSLPQSLLSNAVSARMAQLALFGAWRTPQRSALLGAALAQLPARTLAARLQSVAHCDELRSLASLQCPTLLLRASADRLVPQSATARIQAAVPHAQTHTIAGPHALLQSNPQACAQALASFASTCAP